MDHRAAEGVSADLVRQVGLETVPVRSGGVFESGTITCSHCQRQVVLNPDRSRERGYCPKCDHYLCDSCNLVRVQTGICRTFKQVMDDHVEQVLRRT